MHKKTCGYVYEDLNFKKEGWGALSYPLLYTMRFVLLVYTTLYMRDFLVF